jgi:hypothetical protein
MGRVTVGGNLSQKKRPYKNVSRISTTKATSKRICRYKAITKERKELKHAKTEMYTRNHRTKAECKTGNECVRLLGVVDNM